MKHIFVLSIYSCSAATDNNLTIMLAKERAMARWSAKIESSDSI